MATLSVAGVGAAEEQGEVEAVDAVPGTVCRLTSLLAVGCYP